MRVFANGSGDQGIRGTTGIRGINGIRDIRAILGVFGILGGILLHSTRVYCWHLYHNKTAFTTLTPLSLTLYIACVKCWQLYFQRL